MPLSDFPGFLGYRLGVIAIHADWPIYPAGEGYGIALESLGNFPAGTVFQKLDDIDRCLLLFVGDPSAVPDPFHSRHFHVCLWHEDLIELARRGYIQGAGAVTEREWERERRNGLPQDLFTFNEKTGEYRRVELPHLDEYDDEHCAFAEVGPEGIFVTQRGVRALADTLSTSSNQFFPPLWENVRDLVEVREFDSAVRKAALMIEEKLREETGSEQYGQPLIDVFITQLMESRRYISAYVKVLRGELRTAWKFVRNDYMHNLRKISREECLAILARQSRILSGLSSLP